jgi:modulator of FtsH protease
MMPNGGSIVAMSLGMTGMIFLTLSSYVMASKKDFTYMGGFLFVGVTFAFLASLAGFFFAIPMLNLVVSAVFVLLSSGLIMFHTSNVIQGGETNYILATISLYVALFNLFVSLMHILMAFTGNRD